MAQTWMCASVGALQGPWEVLAQGVKGPGWRTCWSGRHHAKMLELPIL